MAGGDTLPSSYNQGPLEEAERLATHYEAVLSAVVDEAYPEKKELSFSEIFAAPTEPRNAADKPQWAGTSTETTVRALLLAVGMGRETDLGLESFNISPALAVIEGGLVAKMLTELAVMAASPDAVSEVVLSGSAHRSLGKAEIAQLTQLFGEEGAAKLKTEYHAAAALAALLPGFANHDKPVNKPMSYDIHNDFAVGTEQTGQFVELGTWMGKKVSVLRIDREDTPQGPRKFEHQPTSGNVMRIMHDMLVSRKDTDTPIAFVTAATYASRTLQAANMQLLCGDRRFVVPTYGTVHYAEYKGGEPTPPDVNQLEGEMRVMYDALVETKETIKSKR